MAKSKPTTYEIAWLCNGKNPECNKEPKCYYNVTNGLRGGCAHTKNLKYALHKDRDPKKTPQWFDKFSTKQCTRYYERDSSK